MRDDLTCPFHKVLDTLSRWLGRNPEFEILDSVVGLIAVLVVNILIAEQWATDLLRHHQSVLRNVTVLDSVRTFRFVTDYITEMSDVPLPPVVAPPPFGDVRVTVGFPRGIVLRAHAPTQYLRGASMDFTVLAWGITS